MANLKLGNSERTIPFNFAELAATFAWRYPNPFASHIQSTDYFEAPKIGGNGSLELETLTFKSNPLPKIFKTYSARIGVSPPRAIPIKEEIVIDPVSKSITHLSWNVGSRKLLKTHEYSKYTTHSSSQLKVSKHLALASDISTFGVGYLFTQQALRRWRKNEVKASHGTCYSIVDQIYGRQTADNLMNTTLAQSEIQPELIAAKMREKLENVRLQAREKLLAKKEMALSKTKYMKDEVMITIKNPRFLAHILEAIKVGPKP